MCSRLCAVLVAAALWLAACEGPARDEHVVEPSSGRGYRLVVPQGAAEGPRPVLFALHAYATGPDVLVDAYLLVRLAAMHDFVLVVPEGRPDAHGNPHWNASAACCCVERCADDVAYLGAVLADVARRTSVDVRRVAAIGVSNGAFMAQRWAAERPSALAALVSICGAYAPPSEPGTRPVSVLHVHGTADDVVRYDGGEMNGAAYPSAESTLAHWREYNRCTGEPKEARRYTLLFEPIDISTWRGPEAVVSLWKVGGGSHRLRALRLYAAELVGFLAEAVGTKERRRS